MDSRITGHACRVTGAQAMAVAGIELWLVWGLLPLGFAGCLRVCAGLPTGFGDRCASAGCKRPATHGGSTKCSSALGSERVFEEALEESVQGVSVVDLQADQVKEQMQGRVLQPGLDR